MDNWMTWYIVASLQKCFPVIFGQQYINIYNEKIGKEREISSLQYPN